MHKFYVYCYEDKNGPFYIGKGSDDRMFDHLKAAKSKRSSHFLNRIRKLLRESTPPTIKIIQSNLDEKQAFDLEIKLIKEYGRFDLGLGLLLNETNGGDGSSGHVSPKRGKTFDEYYGKEVSSNIKRKISLHAISRRNDIIETNKRVHTGKKLSSEQIEKTRLKTIGQNRTEEQKQNLSRGMLGIKKTFTIESLDRKRRDSSVRFKNNVLVNDGTINKRIPETELTSYLADGWKRGKAGYVSTSKKSSHHAKTKCEFKGCIYDSIRDAADSNQISAYLIKLDPTFKKLSDS